MTSVHMLETAPVDTPVENDTPKRHRKPVLKYEPEPVVLVDDDTNDDDDGGEDSSEDYLDRDNEYDLTDTFINNGPITKTKREPLRVTETMQNMGARKRVKRFHLDSSILSDDTSDAQSDADDSDYKTESDVSDESDSDDSDSSEEYSSDSSED